MRKVNRHRVVRQQSFSDCLGRPSPPEMSGWRAVGSANIHHGHDRFKNVREGGKIRRSRGWKLWCYIDAGYF
jgi:hypothetical protein